MGEQRSQGKGEQPRVSTLDSEGEGGPAALGLLRLLQEVNREEPTCGNGFWAREVEDPGVVENGQVKNNTPLLGPALRPLALT
jgi:hypothetical protein